MLGRLGRLCVGVGLLGPDGRGNRAHVRSRQARTAGAVRGHHDRLDLRQLLYFALTFVVVPIGMLMIIRDMIGDPEPLWLKLAAGGFAVVYALFWRRRNAADLVAVPRASTNAADAAQSPHRTWVTRHALRFEACWRSSRRSRRAGARGRALRRRPPEPLTPYGAGHSAATPAGRPRKAESRGRADRLRPPPRPLGVQLLDGAARLKRLVERAAGFPAIALTDHGNLFGAIDFYQHARARASSPSSAASSIAPGQFERAPRDGQYEGVITALVRNETATGI